MRERGLVSLLVISTIRLSFFAALKKLAPDYIVVPAEAGTHSSAVREVDKWIPAFAGMTVLCR
jgi:hypothetical protein